MEFYISQKDWKKVIDYSKASYDQFDAEIGGFMIAKKNKDGDIIISDPEILKQEVTGGTTVMEKESVADYYVKCAQKYGADVRFVWWHSHANMGAFWSGTDTNTMEEYSSGDWSAFLVVNIRGEYKFRVCVWNPIEAYKDIELNVLGTKIKRIPKAIKESVSKLCSKPTYTSSVITDSNQLSMYSSHYDDPWGGRYSHYSYPSGTAIEKKIPSLLKKSKDFMDTLDFIDGINELYVEGEATYKDWLNNVKDWNKDLKKAKLNYSIFEYTESELHDKVGFYTGYHASDLIDYGVKNEQNIKV